MITIQIADSDWNSVQTILQTENISYTPFSSHLAQMFELLQNDWIYEFVRQQLIRYYEQKIDEYNQTIGIYEQKYGMNLLEFRAIFHSLPQDMFEKEDDDMEWEFPTKLKELALQKLNELKNGRTQGGI